MKKVLFRLVSATILVLTIFVIGSVKVEAQSAPLQFVSPQENEYFEPGETINIKWKNTNFPDDAYMRVVIYNSSYTNVIASVGPEDKILANSGEAKITIPRDIFNAYGYPSGTYILEIDCRSLTNPVYYTHCNKANSQIKIQLYSQKIDNIVTNIDKASKTETKVNVGAKFKLTNTLDSDIYISKNPSLALLARARVSGVVEGVSYKFIDSLSIPDSISGDSAEYYVIPVGSSRIFSYTAELTNTGKLDTVIFSIEGINYRIGSVVGQNKSTLLGAGGIEILNFLGVQAKSRVNISNISLVPGSYIMENGVKRGQNFRFSFDIKNAIPGTVAYFSINPSEALSVSANGPIPTATTSIKFVSVNRPNSLDIDGKFIFVPNACDLLECTPRTIIFDGMIYSNSDDVVGLQTFRIDSVNFLDKPLLKQSSIVKTSSGLERLTFSTSFDKKPAKTLSVTPVPSNVTSGSTTTLNYSYHSNAISAKLFLSCPAGVSMSYGVGGNDSCNIWTTWSPVSNLESSTFTVINKTSKPQSIVLNFYEYLPDNPNYAIGVSSKITVQPINSSSLAILSPLGERTYKFGSTIQIAWNAQSVDADYYYALLENTAIQNLGVVVTGNLPTTSTSTSFVFSKNVLDTFIANGGGLTEEQLRNRYYIRVIGMKNGTSGSRPVINNVSGIFGVSTFESDKGVTVSGAKALLGAPIMSGNNAVAYPVNFNFTMNNLSNGPIYVSTDAKYTTHIEYNSQTPSNVRFASTTALPGSLSGDSSDVFVIPSGASRSFNVFAVLRNYSGVTEQKTVKVSVIQYLTNRASQSYEMVREGLENLRVSLVMDGVASTTGTSTIPVVVICPVGYICNPVGSSYQCPSGYTCSVATLNCPFGYICTALVPKTGTSSVTISKVTLDSYPVYGYVLKVFGTGFDLSNNAVYIDGKRLEFCKTCSPEQGVRPYEGAIQITTDKKRILETLSIKPGVYDLQVQNLATKAYSNKLKIDLTYVSKTEPVVSSPNGGEIFTIGGTIPVTFNSISGFTYELGLIDRRNINDVYYILNSNVVGTGGLQTVRFKTPPGVNSGSKFKVSAFCKNSACDPDTDSSNNYFTITSSTTPPIQTPVITPVPQVNATLSASLLSTNTDRASGRLDGSGFAPGVGWVAGSFDPSDWNWSINLNLMAEKKISSVTVRQTNGEYWSTDNNKQWPLVIVDSVGKQLNSRYTSDFGSFRSGQYNWTLYGQKNTPTWVGGYVTVVFSDGTKVSADISIPAPVACPVGYICNPVNNSSSYCPTGYVCNSVTTNCPAGYTCTTKILKSSLATPVPTPYYSPAPTPYYYSTPVPTPVPTATATPAPTATPYITPSPAPAPSSAPVTTSTPSPSSTPYSTPRPSTSPSPSSSPSAMSAEYDRLQASIWQAVAEWFMGR